MESMEKDSKEWYSTVETLNKGEREVGAQWPMHLPPRQLHLFLDNADVGYSDEDDYTHGDGKKKAIDIIPLHLFNYRCIINYNTLRINTHDELRCTVAL